MVRPFTGQNPAGVKSSNGVLLGFSELFRRFYAEEVYSEAAKKNQKSLYSHLWMAKMISWNSFFLAVHLELSLEDILIQWRC